MSRIFPEMSKLAIYEATLVDHERQWLIHTNTRPASYILEDPFGELQSRLLEWYLQEYTLTDSFEKTKAAVLEAALERYGRQLATELELQTSSRSNEGASVEVRESDSSDGGSTFNSLRWAVLENVTLSGSKSPGIVVTRFIKDMKSVSAQHFTLKPIKTLLILMVTARPVLSEPDSQVVSSTIYAIARQLGSQRVTVNFVRPGIYRALKGRLECARKQRVQYHLVYLTYMALWNVTRRPRM